jgi:hypothetical protein
MGNGCIQQLRVRSALLLVQDVRHNRRPDTVRNPVQANGQWTRMLTEKARNGRQRTPNFSGVTISCLADSYPTLTRGAGFVAGRSLCARNSFGIFPSFESFVRLR